MRATIEVDSEGSATSPAGWSAGAVYAGIKTYGDGKLDLGILLSDCPASVAAVFTKNRLRSAPLDVDAEKLALPVSRGVVVNAGVANSATGDRGIEDARQMAAWAAESAGIPEAQMMVSSTGVIGHFLPMEKIRHGIDAVELKADGGPEFARAIMTTDTRPKHASVRFGPYTLGGCAKGSGMIHPNMATMLAYLTTDAPADAAFLDAELRDAADRSFNLVSVDGDTSPSDTVMLFANGAAGGTALGSGSEHEGAFREALQTLCIHLAMEIARDGEGATKLVEVTVTGAANDAEARDLVRLMTISYLVKTAIHGADPNWGRITGVIGRSAATFEEDAVTVSLCGETVFRDRRPTEFNEGALSEALQGDKVSIAIDLGAGSGAATGWTCDLSAEYVHINADYTT